jgi:hypothetical protein
MATGLKTWTHEEVRSVIHFQWKETFPPIEIHRQPIAAQEDCETSAKCQQMWQEIENGRTDRKARHIKDDCQRSTSRETDFVKAGHKMQ